MRRLLWLLDQQPDPEAEQAASEAQPPAPMNSLIARAQARNGNGQVPTDHPHRHDQVSTRHCPLLSLQERMIAELADQYRAFTSGDGHIVNGVRPYYQLLLLLRDYVCPATRWQDGPLPTMAVEAMEAALQEMSPAEQQALTDAIAACSSRTLADITATSESPCDRCPMFHQNHGLGYQLHFLQVRRPLPVLHGRQDPYPSPASDQ